MCGAAEVCGWAGAPLPPQPFETQRVNHSFYILFPKPFNGEVLLSHTLFLISRAGKCCCIYSLGTEDEESRKLSPLSSSILATHGDPAPEPRERTSAREAEGEGCSPRTTMWWDWSTCREEHPCSGPQRQREPEPLPGERCGGAPWPGHGWGKRSRRLIYTEFGNTTPNLSSLGFFPGARGEGVVRRKEILGGLWVIRSLLLWEELSLDRFWHLAHAWLPQQFQGS